MQTIRDIAKVPTDMYEKPRIPVHIVNCGEVDAAYEKEVDEHEDEGIVAKFERQRKKDPVVERKRDLKFERKRQDLEEEKEAPDGQVKELTGMDKYKAELQLKMNEARRLNNKAVLHE